MSLTPYGSNIDIYHVSEPPTAGKINTAVTPSISPSPSSGYTDINYSVSAPASVSTTEEHYLKSTDVSSLNYYRLMDAVAVIKKYAHGINGNENLDGNMAFDQVYNALMDSGWDDVRNYEPEYNEWQLIKNAIDTITAGISEGDAKSIILMKLNGALSNNVPIVFNTAPQTLTASDNVPVAVPVSMPDYQAGYGSNVSLDVPIQQFTTLPKDISVPNLPEATPFSNTIQTPNFQTPSPEPSRLTFPLILLGSAGLAFLLWRK